MDGGEGRGVPLGGRDQRPPTGYNSLDETEWIEDLREFSDAEFDNEDDGPDRRRDPLRR